MTVKQFAQKAEISLSLAYVLISEGQVPHRRIGKSGTRGYIRISDEDYAEFMERTKAQEVLQRRA